MALPSVTKQPRERFYIGIDCTDELVSGDTIDNGTSVIYEYKMDSNGIYQLQQSPECVEINTKRVANQYTVLEAAVSQGVHEERYKISFLAVTTNGDKFEGDVIIKIKEK